MKLERTAYVLVVVGTGFAISSAFGSPPLNRIQALVAAVMVFTAIAIDLWTIKHRPQPSGKPTFEDGAQAFFTNAADPDYVIRADRKLTEDEMQAYRDRWDAVHGKGEGE